MTSNLDDHFIPSINYTRRDQIIYDLMETIKCPITLDISDDPVLFNYQFYNRAAFDTFRAGDDARNAQYLERWYPED